MAVWIEEDTSHVRRSTSAATTMWSFGGSTTSPRLTLLKFESTPKLAVSPLRTSCCAQLHWRKPEQSSPRKSLSFPRPSSLPSLGVRYGTGVMTPGGTGLWWVCPAALFIESLVSSDIEQPKDDRFCRGLAPLFLSINGHGLALPTMQSSTDENYDGF
jgi:hypothetical protein